MKTQQIAIYIRLSKEDRKEGNESNSIMMQRILLQKFAAENFSDYRLLEFCDDGYTGTNFERPGVQNMLELVRNSKIDCIIVKDFSRFSRDYIELGAYLEQIFPFIGVRFISVNDNYDSKNYKGSMTDIDVNFKGLLYDLYSKDLSQKACSSLAVRKERGQYISGSSPFGYEKDPKDRHGLLIAEDEAEIVRRIYFLTIEGYTSVQIARLFNETMVKTPIEYKIEKGETNRTPKGGRFLWSSSTICQILRNEVYIGNIVQKKYRRDCAGGKNHLRPRDEWITSCYHHKAIIDKEVFDKVQKGRGKKRNPQRNPPHPLTGKLVCGCCKRNLYRRPGSTPYFTCHGRYSNAMEHCVERINTMFLEQYVLFRLQDKLQADGELEKLCAEALNRRFEELKMLKNRRELLSAGIHKMRRQNLEAYQAYAWGRAKSFQSREAMIKSAEDELEDLNKRIQEAEAAYTHIGYGQDSLIARSQFAVLSKEMVDRYIDEVVVYGEQQIEIFWKKKET